MKLTRFKPVEQGMVRLELEISANDLEQISAFNPQALQVIDGDGKKEFELTNSCTPTIKRYGVTLTPASRENADKNYITTISLGESNEIEQLALLARADKYLTIIENQVKVGLVDIKNTKEKIEEV